MIFIGYMFLFFLRILQKHIFLITSKGPVLLIAYHSVFCLLVSVSFCKKGDVRSPSCCSFLQNPGILIIHIGVMINCTDSIKFSQKKELRVIQIGSLMVKKRSAAMGYTRIGLSA